MSVVVVVVVKVMHEISLADADSVVACVCVCICMGRLVVWRVYAEALAGCCMVRKLSGRL